MNIRKMQKNDYSSVDALMQNLHQVHIKGRPDLYINIEHTYSLDEYTKMLTYDNILG